MALSQRILEGDKYPTGSLVVFVVFRIQEHYSNIIECPYTKDPVKHLASILLSATIHPPGILERFGVHMSQKLVSATATLDYILFSSLQHTLIHVQKRH